MDNHGAWEQLCCQVRKKDFALETIQLVKADAEELQISSPTLWLQKRVADKFSPLLADTWKDLTGDTVAVRVLRRSAARVPPVPDDGQLIKSRTPVTKQPIRVFSRSAESADQGSPAIVRATHQRQLSQTSSVMNCKTILQIITDKVRLHYQLEDDLTMRHQKDPEVVLARIMAVYLARTFLGQGYNGKIGIFFDISNSAISYMLSKANWLMRSRAAFGQDFEQLKSVLQTESGLIPK